MMLKHEFVELIPNELDEGKIYISIVHKTALHNCVCGCGMEVVTPISPVDWQLTFDGKSISLHPSIGNWSFPCRSHYWIKRCEVIWASGWSEEEIARGRKFDSLRKSEHFSNTAKVRALESEAYSIRHRNNRKKSIWNLIKSVIAIFKKDRQH